MKVIKYQVEIKLSKTRSDTTNRLISVRGTLRRGCDRRTFSGDAHGIQELFERVATVGIQLRDRYAG